MQSLRFRLLAAALVCGAFTSPALLAQDTPVEGNAARGKVLGYTCIGCHGIPNYKNAYPNYSVPKLQGQKPEYIVAALTAYKNGERSHTTMHAQASSLSTQDMADLAAYFAGTPLKSTPNPNAKPPKSAELCVTCHGTDGVGLAPIYPNLSGQHADYLARALTDYKKGNRRNPIMAPMAAPLTQKQIEELSAYYSKQQPALLTPSDPEKRRTARR